MNTQSPLLWSDTPRAGAAPDTAAMVSLIRDVYARSFGADLKRFAPHLVGLHDSDGTLLGAMGLRDAAADTLFLECYLDEPIEKAIARHFVRDVSRSQIAEIAHLAMSVPGAGRQLLAVMTAHLFQCGYRWVAFTAVQTLRNTFRRTGLHVVPLARAAAERVPGDGTRWGSYYQHDPIVMVGAVAPAYRLLRDGNFPGRPGSPARWAA